MRLSAFGDLLWREVGAVSIESTQHQVPVVLRESQGLVVSTHLPDTEAVSLGDHQTLLYSHGSPCRSEHSAEDPASWPGRVVQNHHVSQ